MSGCGMRLDENRNQNTRGQDELVTRPAGASSAPGMVHSPDIPTIGDIPGSTMLAPASRNGQRMSEKILFRHHLSD